MLCDWVEEAVTVRSHCQSTPWNYFHGENLQALFNIQDPESLGGGLIERSEGGSFDVRVEIEGRVWVG